MLRLSLLTVFLLVGIQENFSQIFDPVKWSFSAERLNGTEAEVTFTATID